MKKILFIDANNLCYRVFWTHRSLSHKGTSVSLLYGFFKALVSIKKEFAEYTIVVVWDSKSQRRVAESELAVTQGTIESSYKSNRQTGERDEEFEQMFKQMHTLREKLELVNVNQVFLKGFEADDIIYSYCKTLEDSDIIAITSDKDYYQMLSSNVKIWDAMKKKMWTKEVFMNEYGIEPSLWVDVGAISGDKSDNIHGAVGWGDVTSLKYVKEYGTMENVIAAVEAKTTRSKKEEALLSFKERLKIAKSLKQMDLIQPLPEIFHNLTRDKKPLQEYFISSGFGSLMLDIPTLVR